jgi:hypothetical protein
MRRPMPRKNPHITELSNQEHKILEAQTHRYTLPYPDVVRAKIALMAAEGLDHHKIAAHLDTRREAVSKWPRGEASRAPRPDGVLGGRQWQLGSGWPRSGARPRTGPEHI